MLLTRLSKIKDFTLRDRFHKNIFNQYIFLLDESTMLHGDIAAMAYAEQANKLLDKELKDIENRIDGYYRKYSYA